MNNSSDKCTCLEVFGEDPTCDLHGGPLRLAVHETFGGRCDQFDPECETCQAWAEIDRLEALTASRAQGVTDGRTQIPLATIMQEPVAIGYTNWRGEYGVRNICPIKVWFGSTDWHPEPQWLLTAIDMDKNAERDFAIKDIGRNEAAQLPARPVVPGNSPHDSYIATPEAPTPASGEQMEGVGFPGIDGQVLTDIDQRGEDDEYQNSPAWLWFGDGLTTFGRWNKGDQVAYIRGDIAATALEAAQKALAEKDAARMRSDDRAIDEYRRANRAEARLARCMEALETADKIASILLQNSEGCAVNHYGDDFQIHGMPGWLADCRTDIESARTTLAALQQKGGQSDEA